MKDTITKLCNAAFSKKTKIPSVWQGSRQISSGRFGRRIFFFPSHKNALSMPCESSCEKDFCLSLEFDDSVMSYRTQPFSLTLCEGFAYTPDVLIKHYDGSFTVVEVKASQNQISPELSKKIELTETILKQERIKFKLIFGEALSGLNKNNYEYLYRGSFNNFSASNLNKAYQAIEHISFPTTIRDIRKQFNQYRVPLLMLEKLILERVLSIDLHKPISLKSKVYLNKEVQHEYR